MTGSPSTNDIKTAVENAAAEARKFLNDIIPIRSTPGNEHEVIALCGKRFARAGCKCDLVELTDDIVNDPEYSHPETPLAYKGRHNLSAKRAGTGGGRSVILQSHADVVPAGDWNEAFDVRQDGDYVIGRGACDAKGQIAAIWLALKALDDLHVELAGDIHAQVVVEEEVGGNGALALIRQGYRADAVVIAEGTQLQVHPANRGAVWFRISVQGRPCHMGRKHEGISAVDLAYKVIGALANYEKALTADSAGYPGFERYENPVQVNVGMLNAGTWPAMVPGEAVIEGGVGFLPNRSMEQVRREVRQAIEGIDDPWLKDHHQLDFPKLHNDSYEIDYAHPAVTTLHQACAASGLESEVFGWNVSCDARLYAKVGGMPTIVFGPGSIADAHARNEKIDFREIVKASQALVRFLIDWCG